MRLADGFLFPARPAAAQPGPLTLALLEHAGASCLEALLRPSPHPVDAVSMACGICLDDLAGLAADMPFHRLLPEGLKQAVQPRQIEFIGGRLCAEHLLASAGLNACMVEQGAAGEPLWPRGVAGSITHAGSMACAAVTLDTTRSIGIDSEQVRDDMAEALASECCTAGERARWLASACVPSLPATLIFSAKESFYKAVYPLVRRFVDFDEMEVTGIDWPGGVIALRTAPGGGADLPAATVRFAVESARGIAVHTFASINLPRDLLQ